MERGPVHPGDICDYPAFGARLHATPKSPSFSRINSQNRSMRSRPAFLSGRRYGPNRTLQYLIEWRRRRRHSDPFIISPRCVGVILFLPPLEIRRRYKQEQFKGFAATPLFSNFPNVQSGPSGNSIKIGICKYSHDNLGKRVSRSASRRTSCQPTIDGLISGRRRETDEKGFP